MEASASDKASPACAVRKAPQSLPPSPTMPVTVWASTGRDPGCAGGPDFNLSLQVDEMKFGKNPTVHS